VLGAGSALCFRGRTCVDLHPCREHHRRTAARRSGVTSPIRTASPRSTPASRNSRICPQCPSNQQRMQCLRPPMTSPQLVPRSECVGSERQAAAGKVSRNAPQRLDNSKQVSATARREITDAEELDSYRQDA